MEIDEGAETAVYLATRPVDGPTEGIFQHSGDHLPFELIDALD